GIYETNCKTVRISVFADYLLYQRCTSSVVKSVQYMNTLFNVVSALYANDRLFLNLSETIVATVSEGYVYSGSDEVLMRFGNLVQGYTYNGDIAHMMTGYYSGGYPPLGGLAWLDVMCQPASPITLGGGSSSYYGPYSMGNVYVSATIPSLPTYSWDVQVTAHELGHNIGSPHTQSCSWPGGPIDGCVDPEGGCTTVAPVPASGGTIMSYCHLAPGVGINFANGFGPLPKALLNSKIVGAPCLRSGLSDSTLRLASKTIVANAECNDGLWTHYFFDNNTSDLSDDIMLLSVKKGALDIGNTANPTFLIRMTTNGFYARDTVPKLGTIGYADTGWYEINRKWTIQLPSGKQPTTAVTVRYPYLNQDVKDISKVLLPKVVRDTNLVFLKYANYTPVTSLPTATAADMRRLGNSKTAASAKDWFSGSTGTYRYAEIVADSGLYGGTLGYQIPAAIPPKPSGINESLLNQKVNIHPNPANSRITIDAPAGYSGMQQVFIYDNLGRVLYQQQIPFTDGQLSVDIAALASGVYTLKCLGTQSALNGIFIKQ
ncbi:MAG: zinc-dependent metalloprotease, partial [Chitinophagaceae bacterium]|nr:zinc-dependent metalloprotease [Chitinophagaceae bacterium]